VGLIFLMLSIPAAIWIRKIEKNINLAQGKIKKEQL
jgi:polar amino acid transport system permease protein